MTATSGQPEGASGKRYVRTFLFSMQIDSPLARLHVITKVVAILATSFLIVRLMDARHPDPLGAGVLMVVGFALILLGGAGRWLFRSYLVVIYPMLFTLLLVWILFNPDPGSVTYFSRQLYDGTLHLNLTFWIPVFLVVAWGVGRLSRRGWLGILAGLVVASGLARLDAWPVWPLASVAFLKPWTLVVSDANVLVALTKVMGFAAMIFISLVLVMTTRDIELIGAMQQLRVPYAATFFLSIVMRSLTSAVMDYETIQQAQVARGIDLQARSILGRIRDLAKMSVPLTATMIRRSTDVSDAVAARGFRLGGRPPREYREAQGFRVADWAVLGVQVLMMVAVFGLSLNLSDWLARR